VRRAAFLVVVALLAGGWEGLREADPDVEQGNRAYREGRFADALGHYRVAEERGASPALHFDIGSALYKLGEKATDPNEKTRLMQQAEDELRRAADTDDAGLKSSAYFNLGNTLYRREQWEDAIAAYKRALRADSKNDAARNNLEMALRQRQKGDPKSPPRKGQDGQKGQQGQNQKKDKDDEQKDKGQGDQADQKGQDPAQGEPDPAQQGQPGQDGQQPPDKDPRDGQPDPRQGQEPGKGGQGGEPDRQPGQQGKGQADRQRDGQPQPAPSDPGDSMDGSPSDQERKLDELERRSRELRKRLLRQGGKNRDPMKLPPGRDW
jgi:Ca-activated chloride channel family protein